MLNAILGNASEINQSEVQAEFTSILISDEQIVKVYKIIRDMFVFTNKRLVLVDKQGVTGKKVEYLTIPYNSITLVAKESAGTFDLDEELKIWIRGFDVPVTKKFKKGSTIDEVYQLISSYII
jgi:hypothetical protein